MAWPISTSTVENGFGYKSILPTTLAWGTEGIITGVIVTSIKVNQMIEEITVENGSGVISALILINSGDQVEITVVDDRSNLSWPRAGDIITLINPLPSGLSISVTTNFIVIDNSYQGARKAPGERTILGKAFKNIPTAQM